MYHIPVQYSPTPAGTDDAETSVSFSTLTVLGCCGWIILHCSDLQRLLGRCSRVRGVGPRPDQKSRRTRQVQAEKRRAALRTQLTGHSPIVTPVQPDLRCTRFASKARCSQPVRLARRRVHQHALLHLRCLALDYPVYVTRDPIDADQPDQPFMARLDEWAPELQRQEGGVFVADDSLELLDCLPRLEHLTIYGLRDGCLNSPVRFCRLTSLSLMQTCDISASAVYCLFADWSSSISR